MPRLETVTPEGILLVRTIAGAGSRFAAGLLDGLIVALVYLVTLLGLSALSGLDPSGVGGFVAGILIGGVPLCLAAYHFLFHAFWGGRTPGKRLLGLRVASADGYPASILQNLLRSALWPVDAFLPIPAPFGWLGLAVIVTTPKRQRLGDLVAGTLVLREEDAARPPRRLAAPGRGKATPIELGPRALARLDDEDFVFLRELFGRKEMGREERKKLERSAARYFAERLEHKRFDNPRSALRDIYRFLTEARSHGLPAGEGTNSRQTPGAAADPGNDAPEAPDPSSMPTERSPGTDSGETSR